MRDFFDFSEFFGEKVFLLGLLCKMKKICFKRCLTRVFYGVSHGRSSKGANVALESPFQIFRGSESVSHN